MFSTTYRRGRWLDRREKASMLPCVAERRKQPHRSERDGAEPPGSPMRRQDLINFAFSVPTGLVSWL